MEIIQGDERDPAINDRKDAEKFAGTMSDVWNIVAENPKGFLTDINLLLQAKVTDAAAKRADRAADNLNVNQNIFSQIGTILGFAAGANKNDLMDIGAKETQSALEKIKHDQEGIGIAIKDIARTSQVALMEITGWQYYKDSATKLIWFGGMITAGGKYAAAALKFSAARAVGAPAWWAWDKASAAEVPDMGWGDARRQTPIHISPPGMSPGFLRDVALPALARRGGTRHKRRTKRHRRRHHRRKTRHKGKRKRVRTRRRQRRRKRRTRR